jgi:hypothetical protein
MNVLAVASVSPIAADPPESRKLYADALGLPLEKLDGEYYASEKIGGSKHFGVWPLSQAARPASAATSGRPTSRARR